MPSITIKIEFAEGQQPIVRTSLLVAMRPPETVAHMERERGLA